MKRNPGIILSLLILIIIGYTSCNQKNDKQSEQKSNKDNAVPVMTKTASLKITFIELGSVNCIPCKKMQPIMKNIEQKYREQVKVIFYDVWKDESPANQYGIKLIPTQIFLDENGKEFFRHEGFYPEKDIDELLLSKGLKAYGV
jgi:thioredoxin 1